MQQGVFMIETTRVEPSELVGKYLIFNLMDESYGVNVEMILQIIGMTEITMIPKTPEYVKGVIKYREMIIPVIDLRLKFQLPIQDYNERTCIVLIKIQSEQGGEICIGIIIDKVEEVLDILENEIEKSPTFGVDIDTQFILGMAKVKQKVATLLNMSRILTHSELAQLNSSYKKGA